MFLLILVAISSFGVISADICADIDYSCWACIGNSFGCVWCADEVHNDTRCRLEGNPLVSGDIGEDEGLKKLLHQDGSWCNNLVNPPRKLVTAVSKEDDKDPDVESVVLADNSRSNHVSISARPRHTVQLKWNYKHTTGFPIDMYFLFDGTETVEKYKQEISSQTSQVSEQLQDIGSTKSTVRFGIGSLDASFEDYVALTEDFLKLTHHSEIKNEKTTLDAVLDGILYALNNERIGWNYDKKSRRILMVFCDPTSMKPSNEDTKIKELNTIVSTKGINIVLAGLKQFPEEYKELVKKIRGSKYLQLQDNTDDETTSLASRIKEEFTDILNTVEIDTGVLPSHIKITTEPSCEKFGQRCIYKGTFVEVQLFIEMGNCPTSYKKNEEELIIRNVGSLNSLQLDTKINCKCDCTDDGETKSPRCNYYGDYICGFCECIDGRYGDSCQCVGNRYADFRNCIDVKNDDYQECSGHGNCICGECVCNDGYTGKICAEEIRHKDNDDKKTIA